MKEYFYSDGVNKFGPFSLEELRGKNITKETLVWFQGLSEWLPAGSISELSHFFSPSPPPLIKESPSFNTIRNNTPNQQPPKTWLVESILATLFCCLPLGNATKVETRFYAGDINGANQASADAAKWTKLSFGIGIAGVAIYIVIMLIGGASGY